MLSLDRHSLEKFVENPEEYVLRKQGEIICAEKKGAWTWIKSHVLDRQSYNLQKIVPYLRERDDVSQKLQEVVDKKIEQFNQKYETKGHKIVPLIAVRNTAQRASKKRVFFGEQKVLQFNVNEAPKSINTKKPLYQELKEDRGINPTDRKLRRLPNASIQTLIHRLRKGKTVSEKQLIDAFDKDCLLVIVKLAGTVKINLEAVQSNILPTISQSYSQAIFTFSNGRKTWGFETFQKEVLSNFNTTLEIPSEEGHRSIKDEFLRCLKQIGSSIPPEELVFIMIKRQKELLNLYFSQNQLIGP